MASYLVAYDLIKETEHDYEDLWAELKRIGAHRTQLSLWLVSSSFSASQLHDALKSYMHEKDRLWVAELAEGRHTYSQAIGGTKAWLAKHPPRRCA